jgi:hypothetical protein
MNDPRMIIPETPNIMPILHRNLCIEYGSLTGWIPGVGSS